ncbi:hypothetical protein TRVA0_035S00782 [Trichomonascus vanleenenianus]|uniref:phenylalanine--tRNA ligase subunit beta n=1 Tax=Trichomonascus vanleenenianus TaxID=2268995 RepID=UPI003ECB060F
MPTISVDKEDLFTRLGRTYSTQEFDELCFEFGIELDEDTTEECAAGERPQLKIEIPANRYDLLCIEGIARALNIFLGRDKAPDYRLVGKPVYKMVVDKETQPIRQFVAGAVLRGIKFDERRYESFIALQDKLHANLCRNRTLVAIGTHDADKIVGTTIDYRAPKPQDIKFVPLKQTQEFTGTQLMELYESDKNLSKYLHIIQDQPGYPLFTDEANGVLSMPPIINSERTKITLDTKNVFIDVTATDKTKIEIVINELVAMFSEYCAEPFTVEPIEIVSPHNNESRICPDLTPRHATAEIAYLNSCLGLSLSAKEICGFLEKMGHRAAPASNPELVEVWVPPSRPDILHQCDILEDLAIGYGFNNLKRTFPSDSYTVASALPVNKVSDIVRREAAMASWAEVMPLTLCSHDENFKFLRVEDDGKTAVKLANPKTTEYEVVRTTLLPGLLKTIRENRKHALPLKIFEVGDVVFKDATKERKTRNARRFSAVYAGKSAGFEIVHGLLDRVMKMLRVPYTSAAKSDRGYWIDEATLGTFFPGRGAKIFFREAEGKEPVEIGTLGVLHPEVMANYDIPYVGSSLELDIQVFV